MEFNPVRPDACPAECPGCAQIGWPRARGEAQKQAWLERALEPWRDRLRPLQGPPEARRLGYRRKTTLRARWNAGEARWDLGLLKRSRRPPLYEERVIDIPHCPVHAPELRARLRRLAAAVPAHWPLHSVVAAGDLVTLVLKAAEVPPDAAAFVAGSDWSGLGLKGLFLNLHPSAGDRVLGTKGWLHLWGQARASEDGGVYGPSAFQQLIPELYEDALARAQAFLQPAPERAIVDLCSGIGRSLARWRAAGADALGVELSGEAVECAALNGGAALRGKASERIPQLREWVGDRAWAVFANPPRLGLEPEVTRWLATDRPARLAYLSCSAGTLRRDLEALTQSGFEVDAIFPYDFFPQTSHVETLALLKGTP